MMRAIVAISLLVVACGGEDAGQALAGETGGAAATGGTPGAGGEVSTGGISSGGALTTGGAASSTGGAASGAGGVNGTGGTVASTGGAPTVADAGPDAESESDAGPGAEVDAGSASGGAPGTGGAAETGGAVATGGASTGGVAATGGTQATGGAPACECTSGPCCDGCQFRPTSYACLRNPANGTLNTPYSTECQTLGQLSCSSGYKSIIEHIRFQYCSGVSPQCDGVVSEVGKVDRHRDCESGTSCRIIGSGLTAAQCAPCD